MGLMDMHVGDKIMRRYGWKQTYANGYTRNGFFWPLVVGAEVRSDDKPVEGDHICPRHSGDGLSIGLTARGICQGGIHSSTILIVSWNAADTAGEDDHKVRVLGPVRVEAVLDRDRMLRQQGASADLAGAMLTQANLADANLVGANLTGTNLSGAYLAGANLYDAYLVGANLTCANLTYASLSDANLTYANLAGADLTRANLTGVNLYGASLPHANLYDANLTQADLTGANLYSANLAGAYLTGTNLGEWERGPDGYARRR